MKAREAAEEIAELRRRVIRASLAPDFAPIEPQPPEVPPLPEPAERVDEQLEPEALPVALPEERFSPRVLQLAAKAGVSPELVIETLLWNEGRLARSSEGTLAATWKAADPMALGLCAYRIHNGLR